MSKIITEEMRYRQKACVVKYVKKAIESLKLIVRAIHAMKGWKGSFREIRCK